MDHLNAATTDIVPLSAVFIDEYMPCANPAFCLVYILGLRSRNTNLNIASVLGVSDEFVSLAWKYWESEGLVKRIGAALEFLPVFSKKAPAAASTKRQRSDKPVYSVDEIGRASCRERV